MSLGLMEALMTRRLLLLCSILLLSSISLGRAAPQTGPRALVLANVNVIDATGAPVRVNMTVVIEGGRITEIGEAATVRSPRGARVVEAKGRYLIPGLWDMHVHWYDERLLPLFIANGVTGVRQMFGFPMHLDWRTRAARGELLSPRLFVGSPIVDGPTAMWEGSIKVGNEAEGRQAVRKIKSDGYDFVKIYSDLPRDAYYAIADEAARQGLAFAGHLPHSVTAQEASDAGQKSIEHLTGVLEGCSPVGAEITAGYVANRAGADSRTKMTAARLQVTRGLFERVLATYDQERATALFARFARNGTWQCPTIVVNRASAMLGDKDFRNDPRLKYMPAAVRSSWQPGNNPLWASRTAEDYALRARRNQKEAVAIAEMRRAGVRFLAGTDTANPFCFPGFSLHDELTLLVDAGLTPMESLQSATSNAAIFAGKADSLGTIEKGKIADLVLLDANPLDQIANTRRIAAVVVGGELFDRPRLDAMLVSMEKRANPKSIADALMKTIDAQGVAAAVRQYHALEARDPDAYDFGEPGLYDLGTRLLKAAKIKDAIAIFKLNVAASPRSSWAHYCLAEAYLAGGDKANAIASCKRALALDPEESDAAEMLKKLGKGDKNLPPARPTTAPKT
jgi:imidazolonepropionase-like amidohydrolase